MSNNIRFTVSSFHFIRIVADMRAYKSKSPRHGDLVLLKHKSSPALFIKRIIGIQAMSWHRVLTERFSSTESH